MVRCDGELTEDNDYICGFGHGENVCMSHHCDFCEIGLCTPDCDDEYCARTKKPSSDEMNECMLCAYPMQEGEEWNQDENDWFKESGLQSPSILGDGSLAGAFDKVPIYVKINGEIVNNYPVFQRTKKFKIGFVPQYGGYFGDLSLHNNLKAIGEITINNKILMEERINYLISKFELDNLKDIKAKFLSGGQKKKLVIAISLISDPKILLLDEPFAALDVMTIKTLQEIIVELQSNNNISVILCDHQARDLLACVDTAAIVHNGKVIAQGTPTNLIKNIEARNAYFGESFKIN